MIFSAQEKTLLSATLIGQSRKVQAGNVGAFDQLAEVSRAHILGYL